ncbi:MAG: alpha/beta fold hydrolase [Crocinitomicaceae bacterium]
MGTVADICYAIANRYIDGKFRRANMKHKFHDSDQYHIEYWDSEEEGKPVFLILHGLGAKAKYQWYDQLHVLKDDFRIIVPNLLHFGETVPHSSIHGVGDQIEMVQFLLNELKVSKYHLMGASYGGLISGEIANNYPEQVEKLILVDAAIKYMYESDKERVKNLFDVPSIPEFFVPDTHQGLKKLLAASVGEKGVVPPEFTMPRFHEELYMQNFEDKRLIVNRMMAIRDEYAEHVYEFKMPVHLIWGELDQLVPTDRGELFFKHIGGDSTFDIIKGGGHMPNMNKTKEFNKLLKRHLEI